jgi:hypothetical protein
LKAEFPSGGSSRSDDCEEKDHDEWNYERKLDGGETGVIGIGLPVVGPG